MNETTSYDAVIKSLQMLKRVRRLEGSVLIHEGVLLNADTLYNERQISGFVREVNAILSQYRNGNRPLSRALLGFDAGNVMVFNVLPFTLCLFFGKLEDAVIVEKAGEEFLLKWADSLHLEVGSGIELPELIEGSGGSDRELVVPEVPNSAPETPGAVKITESIMMPIPLVALSEIMEAPILNAVPEPIPEVLPVIIPAPVAVSAPVLSTGATDSAAEGMEKPMLNSGSLESWSSFRVKIESLLSKVLGHAQATRLIERELTAMGISAGGYLTHSQYRPFGRKLVEKVKDKSLRRQLEIELVSHLEDHLH